MRRDTIYDRDLDRVPANHQPLTPLGYLDRAARVFPDHVAVIHGPLRRTYASFSASSLTGPGSTGASAAAVGPPLATPTMAGRSTRSPIE